ncbi:nuclease-related domain-containing protein [Oceanobacillus bengalensis]|uniref:nuclease-related domain-containing protein n=1 Tax=Oceanobacillus bengalensis TaxID=1435466 RepID=UPI0016007B9E|nr:nuclease-related domain-containing protein [Oceanobacillus bengalensis]
MFVKPLQIFKYILEAEALERRISSKHPKKEQVTSFAKRHRAGYNGEKALEFPLSFLPYDDFFIFFHLRIPDHDSENCFQIDILLLNIYFILIIETKNIDGTVLFDDMGQSIRQKNNKEDIFTNPIDQVNLQHLRLLRWIREFNLPPIPIEKLVVYSNQNTLLKNLSLDKNLINIVVRKENLLSKIDQFTLKYQTKCFSENDLLSLSNELLVADSPEDECIMKKFDILKRDIIKGVFCPECRSVPMKRIHGKWNCMYCGAVSKTAHKEALKDYLLLFGEYITNRQARDFLKLESIDTTKRILHNENLEQIGVKSGRKYKLKYDFS